MILKRFYEERLAQASYLVGCAATGEAIVVDPNRDLDQYIAAAKAEGLHIAAVTETHIHADFVSGSRTLAERTGAKLYVSAEGGPEWQYEFTAEPNVVLLRDGDTIRAGNIRLDAMHTPGHTPEHLTFLLTDEPASASPLGAFTGDFLFVGDVGRPDLLERAAGITGAMRKGGSDLFHSLRKFNSQPGHLMIWPAHGAGSACGKSLGGVPVSSLGYERLANWAFAFLANGGDEQGFVESVLADQPEPPLYFAEMKRVNKIGLSVPGGEPVLELAVPELKSARESGLLLLDVRAVECHAKAGLPDSIEIPLMRNFTTWAGSLVAYGEPIYMIADSATQVAEAAKALRMIGIDRIAGWFNAATLSPGLLEPLARISAEDASRAIARGTATLDVRGGTEYRKGHIDGAIHIPLGYLPKEFASLPKNAPLIAYCSSGIRSAVAASYLRRKGFGNVRALEVGMGALQSTQAREQVGAA